MPTLPYRRLLYNLALVAVLVAALLAAFAAPVLAFAPCYCHPKLDPWNNCHSDWVVRENVTGHNNVVCNGAPPGSGGLVFGAPHPCPELQAAIADWELLYWPSGHTQNPASYIRGALGSAPIMSTYTLARGPGSFACIGLPEPFYGPHFIPLWPGQFPGHMKESLQRVLRVHKNHIRDLHRRLESVPPFGPEWRTIKTLIASAINTAASLIMSISDPINYAYAKIVAAPVLPAYVPLVAGGGLTAAQASAVNAWAVETRTLNGHLQHFNKTVDSLSGALEATPGPLAAQWAVTHAQQLDALGDLIAAAGAAELAKRSAVMAAYPTVAIPASCLTSLQLGSVSADAVAFGADMYELGQYHEFVRDEPCDAASSFPGSMLVDLPSWQNVYAEFANLQHAAAVCAQAGYCAPAPALTPVPTEIILPPVPVNGVAAFDLRIQNTGTAPLVIGVIGLQGGQAAMFQLPIGKNFCQGKTLATGASCLVRVRFVPTAVGSFYTKIRVPSNDPASPVKLVRVTGVGQ